MASTSLHQFLKRVADSSIRVIAEWMPQLGNEDIIEIYVAAPPYKPTLPVNIDAMPTVLAVAFNQTVSFKPHKIYGLNNVEVSWDGVIFKNFKIFIPSLVRPHFIRRLQDTFLLRQWFGQHLALPNSAPAIAIIHDEWSVGNYYHWLVDALPRLLVLREKYPNHLLLVPDFLPPRQTPDYIKASASALGFNNFFSLNTRQILDARRVILPELTAESLFQNPALIMRVRTELIKAFGLENVVPKRRIYASRSTQAIRKLLNEDEIEELLLEYGFETVHFEDFNFLQQVHLMQQTSVFLGIHGAGMTNLMFLQPEASVIELLNEENGDLCYFRLASCCSLPYFCMPCTSADATMLNQSDMVVDKVKLKEVIQLAITE